MTNKTSLYEYLTEILGDAFLETMYMIIVPTVIATILGFILAIILILTKPNGLKPNKPIYSVVGFVVNIVRSFPFIILLVALIPFTRLIVGTSIGETAAIVPITIGAAPFIARIIETALNEVDEGLIEAAKSFGATNTQIVFKVMIKEAMPSIVSGITLSVISILGYTAMAGTVGAGGL
ncbi:MAG: methionine ABC transporter permease, partial [Intestinibacter sp.]